eukprot:1188311-Prorocentrum_minimum.AAC.4
MSLIVNLMLRIVNVDACYTVNRESGWTPGPVWRCHLSSTSTCDNRTGDNRGVTGGGGRGGGACGAPRVCRRRAGARRCPSRAARARSWRRSPRAGAQTDRRRGRATGRPHTGGPHPRRPAAALTAAWRKASPSSAVPEAWSRTRGGRLREKGGPSGASGSRCAAQPRSRSCACSPRLARWRRPGGIGGASSRRTPCRVDGISPCGVNPLQSGCHDVNLC